MARKPVVKFEMFRGVMATWPELFKQAAEFSTTLGRDRLIAISHSEDKEDGVIAGWYWDEVQARSHSVVEVEGVSMSLLSGITIGLFRETRDGRRVLGVRPAGFRPVWYLVSDSKAPVVERRFRRIYAGVFLAFLPAVIVLSGPNWWLIAAMVLLIPFAMRYWVLRGLPRTALAEEELIPVDRKARLIEQSQAFGEPTMWVLMIAVILMGALGLSVAIADGDWWAWLGVVMFGTMAVIMARQILMVRRARREHA